MQSIISKLEVSDNSSISIISNANRCNVDMNYTYIKRFVSK